MYTISTQVWAKKSDKKGFFEWLPLGQHLEDTRLIINQLWEHWLTEGQKQIIVQSLDQKDIEIAKQLALFIASIHDIGKATPAFQTKPSYYGSTDLDNILIDKLEAEGFKGIKNFDTRFISKTPHTLAGMYILTQFGVQEDIASIIDAHHGSSIDDIQLNKNQMAYPRNYYQDDAVDTEVYQKWVSLQEEILNRGLELAGFNSISELPRVNQPGQVILTGLLIMADWIASNENYFQLLNIDEITIDDQEERLQNAWYKWQKARNWEPSIASSIEDIYQERFNFSPRDAQKTFSELIEETTNPGIFIFEAPMGIGKTEAALVAAEQLAEKTNRSGVFFGLPTQATSNGIFPRIKEWLENIVEENDEYLSLRLVHGKAALNKDFESLATNVNIDDGKMGSVFINQWFSGRKTTALDDFVVGTIDQFLLTGLKQKHLALRHLGFSKKVVILDEVHAYDTYMGQYLYRALEWMGSYGVPVIVLSATLPASTRKEIAISYLKGKGLKEGEMSFSQDDLNSDLYPLVTFTESNEIKVFNQFSKPESKEIEIHKINSKELQTTIKDIFEYGGNIGIVVNTVKRAQELAQFLGEKYGQENILLLHSNFIATDRIQKENDLLNMVGKNAKRPQHKIVIGTQVIEQSLDIDFDVMFSDLAPMDLLIQRIGRLHRHNIKRPEKHKQAKFYVIGSSEELEFDKGSSAVYGEYLLARTQHYLPETIQIPKDISPLVQKVYSAEDLQLEESLISKFEKMKISYQADIQKKEDRSKTYRLSKPAFKKTWTQRNSMVGWIKNVHPNETEEYGYAQVRDSNDTIEIIALKKYKGGYSYFENNEDLSSQINNPKIAKDIAQRTLRLPNVLSRPYNINQTIAELEDYNRRELFDWQDEVWLKGNLGIIFDEQGKFELNGYKLSYSQDFGLVYERMDDNE